MTFNEERKELSIYEESKLLNGNGLGF